jgi:hypothetical protein
MNEFSRDKEAYSQNHITNYQNYLIALIDQKTKFTKSERDKYIRQVAYLDKKLALDAWAEKHHMPKYPNKKK